MTHPLALTDHKNGAKTMIAGCRALYTINGRYCTVDEFLQDGDAYVTWDDGTYGTIKRHNLEPA